jgi:GAF domain-containing protein
VGVLTLTRFEVRPISDKQIALVATFANQAAIATENKRLFEAEQQHTRELAESLEQQTATSEVLQVISSSPGDLQPVFESLLRNATQLCKAKFGTLYLREESGVRLVAAYDMPAKFYEVQSRAATEPAPGGPLEGALRTKRAVQIPDLAATELYRQRHPRTVDAVELGHIRTAVAVPMLKDDEPIGVISIHRPEVALFDEKQIRLLTSFAAQAVIAIENARLLNELRQRTTDLTERTADLTEALEQQTATSEVLQVISGSPGDLQPVFATMLEKAVHICDATFGNIYRWDGDALQLVATHNTPPAYAEHRKRSPFRADQNNAVAHMIASKKVVHVLDAAANETYVMRRDPTVVAAVELGKIRSSLVVPMLKEDELIGAFIVSRQEVRPFTDKQIALVTNFAAQAVIAIENARLLQELRHSLDQQMATAQVLEVISSSTGDLGRVFATILEHATRICQAKFGTLYLKEGDGFRAAATHNAPPAYQQARVHVVHPSPHTAVGRAANAKQPVQIADVTLERAYMEGETFVISAVKMGGYRSVLSVPMLHKDDILGIITIFRQEVSSFSEEHISLMQNFAAQAVIAIENVRLLNDLRDRTEQLAVLNQQLEQRVADQVGEIERMSKLRRFLPPQVADLIVASGTEKQLESHRREITALFCDLRGFTGFSESADPEDVMALLRDYHAAIGEIIIKYSGTLERYAGDGVMVVFNDPVPVEKPALQAVMLALEMREAIGGLTGNWRQLGHEIGFGIGMAHGYATLGTIGFEGRFDYAAIGTVSNVASRLCDEAKPGQILISPRVMMLVKDAVTVEAVGEFELKGIRRPIAAYNVLASSSANL